MPRGKYGRSRRGVIVKGFRRGPWTQDSEIHFIKRDKVLFKMGFASYKDYLRSNLWASIRARVLSLYKKCGCCREFKPQCVHHHNYKPATMKGNSIKGLVALCNACHVAIEYKGHVKRQDEESITRAFVARINVG